MEIAVSWEEAFSILKMEAGGSSETLVTLYRSTQRRITRHSNLHFVWVTLPRP
jgi:hypothetical protein